MFQYCIRESESKTPTELNDLHIYATIAKTFGDKHCRVGIGHTDPIKQELSDFFCKSQTRNSLGFEGHSLCHNYSILPL